MKCRLGIVKILRRHKGINTDDINKNLKFKINALINVVKIVNSWLFITKACNGTAKIVALITTILDKLIPLACPSIPNAEYMKVNAMQIG